MARSERRGFTCRIEPAPWATPKEARLFLRALEDYAAERDLVLDGTQLVWLVSSDERALTEADQIDLLDWLIRQRVVGEATVTPLTSRLDAPAPLSDGFCSVRPFDPVTICLSALYRARRLTPAMVLHALGGFVRPVVH